MEKEREAVIHSTLYHDFESLFENGKIQLGEIIFGKVDFLKRLDTGGIPDLVIRDESNRPWLVIETKRVDRPSTNIDPFSMTVIKQALSYAIDIGAPYFATCNRDILVLFKTFDKFKPITQREIKYYNLKSEDLKIFVKELLYDISNLQIGKATWSPPEEVLIGRFRALHELISPILEISIIDTLKDNIFEKQYSRWLEDQGFEISKERNEITAKQMAYLLMNKILFYKTIESKYNLPILREINVSDVRKGLKEYFDRVVHNVDFKAIFESDKFYDRVPIPLEVTRIINEFIEELKYYNLEKVKSDILGMVYKNLIPIEEKKRFGQYYTPPEICDLITSLCMIKPTDIVLDPACGSGSFLIKAYHRLKELKEDAGKEDEDKIHNEILDQIYGVDINQFPAHLSVMNLAMQNIQATNNLINVVVSDFFKTRFKGFDTQKTEGLDKEGRETEIPKVDCIIGNPPYIRQELITNKDAIRKVALENVGLHNKISEKSDIYVYFFIHSSSFLKNGGKLGFITSNAWLDTDYGDGLKTFFLDKYKIISVIALDQNAFEDALANTCITILEKENNKELRSENKVKFIRIKKHIDVNNIIKILKMDSKDFEDESVKQVTVKQKYLKSEDKWGIYHKAPQIYFKLETNPLLINLTAFANVSYPYKTSANEFFILKKSEAEQWGIEKEYLHPVITTPKTMKKIKPNSKEIKEFLLVVNEQKAALEKKHANVLKYIEYGENKNIVLTRGSTAGEEVRGYQNIPSFKKKKLWYNLENKIPAPILFPALIWDKNTVIWNSGAFYATHNFYQIYPKSENNTLLLLAYLNSSLNAFFMELYGRIPGGRTLSLMVYEVERLPVPNFDRLKLNEKKAIKKVFLRLVETQDKGKVDLDAKINLDEIIFDILKMTEQDRKSLYKGLSELKETRMHGLHKKQKKDKVKFSVKQERGRIKRIELLSLNKWMEDNN